MTKGAQPEPVVKFGDLVRNNLARLGWTIRDLEASTGIAYRVLRKVINDNRLLEPQECVLIERALGMKEGTAHALDRAEMRAIARRWGNRPAARPSARDASRRLNGARAQGVAAQPSE